MGLLDGNGRPPGPALVVAQPLAADATLALVAATLLQGQLDLLPSRTESDEPGVRQAAETHERHRMQANTHMIQQAVEAAAFLFQGAHVRVKTGQFNAELRAAVVMATADPRDREKESA